MIILLANWGSGATMISQILDNHSQITCNGEIFTNPVNGKCSCGELFYECSFLQKACEHMRFGQYFDPKFYRTVPAFKSSLPLVKRCLLNSSCAGKLRNTIIEKVPSLKTTRDEFIAKHLQFSRMACQINGSKLYIDGSKSIRRAELFIERKVVKKVIYLVRDPRAQMASVINSKSPVHKRLKSIITYHQEVKALQKIYPQLDMLIVRFEEVCNNPTETLTEVLNFLDLEYEPNLLNLSATNQHIFGSTRVRGNKFTKIEKQTEKWRNRLSKQEIALTESSCAYMFIDNGYLIN